MAGEESMIRRAPATWAILIVIAIVFAFEVMNNALDNSPVLENMGAIVPNLLQRGEYWRLVAAMFLHASWLHWFVNTWALYQLGSLYEMLFGSRRFLIVYFVSGIFASTASSLFIKTAGVGASGAIFGVLGAFIFSLLRSPYYRHQRWTRSLVSQIIFWICANMVITFFIPMIDKTAHIAGLIAGLLLGLLPHRVPPPSPREAVVDVSLPPEDQAYVLRREDPFIDHRDDSANRR